MTIRSIALPAISQFDLQRVSVAKGGVLAVLVAIAALSGCGGNGAASAPPSSTVTSVAALCSPSSILTNQTTSCAATVSGTGSYNSAVTWSVSPASVGSIGNSGIFAPSTAGTATITATSTQDTSKSGSATVTVTSASTITSVAVNCSPSSIPIGQTSTCSPTVTGTGSYGGSVTWSVSPSGIGSLSSGGVFTAAVAGTATIAATATQDTTKSGMASITIIPAAGTPLPAVTISSDSSDVFVGQPVTLTWSSTGASFCTASGAWSGTQATNGSTTVTPSVAGQLTYALSCNGAGGTGSGSTTISANPAEISIANSFSPNALTISTSEGAPYADCDFWVTSAGNCTNETGLGYGPTKLIRLYICLTGEVTRGNCSQQPALTGPISAQMLSDIDARLSAYQGTGMRVMPRFIYNFGPSGPTAQDAPLSVILNHIDQLAPILLKYKDIVFALEAGFVGTWGEWHDSTNGNDTPSAQQAILDKELSYFNGDFPILVRYPGDLIQYAGGLTAPAGFGLHDDYYASRADDAGTWDLCTSTGGWCLSNYTVAQFETFAQQVSQKTMFVGEFGALYSPLQTCNALDSYSYTYSVQSIGLPPYPSTIGTELQNEGCALSFYNKVGTRIELQKATVIGNPTANGQIYIALTLANTGYGRVIRQRPASILLLSGSNVVAQFALPLSTLNLTQLAASAVPVAQTFATTLTLPGSLPPGEPIHAVLLIPDPAPSLTGQAAYALPLNSVDSNYAAIFDSATGYNLFASFTTR